MTACNRRNNTVNYKRNKDYKKKKIENKKLKPKVIITKEIKNRPPEIL
jgi:hypothetical protein